MGYSAGFGRAAFLLPLFALLPGIAAAAEPGPRDWWYELQRGRLLFGRGDYGNALMAFEDARRGRRAAFDQMERDLVDLLSLPSVRRMGDSLEWVDRYARERHFAAAAAALDELYFRVPRERFGNSALAALEAFGGLRYFPEAEMWIGRAFMAGGEPGLALIQFERALSQGAAFGSPALELELLHEIADARRLRGEYRAMEAALRSIVEGSALWDDGAGDGWQAGSFVREAMARTLQADGADRFLELYRYGNAHVMRAHRELGFFYAADGRHGRALEHLMFAFLIQNTVVIDELIRRRFDFAFTTLGDLAGEIERDMMLSGYAEEMGYYRVAFYLGNALFGSGHERSARGLWSFVAGRSGAGEWQARAAAQLRSPRIPGPAVGSR